MSFIRRRKNCSHLLFYTLASIIWCLRHDLHNFMAIILGHLVHTLIAIFLSWIRSLCHLLCQHKYKSIWYFWRTYTARRVHIRCRYTILDICFSGTFPLLPHSHTLLVFLSLSHSPLSLSLPLSFSLSLSLPLSLSLSLSLSLNLKDHRRWQIVVLTKLPHCIYSSYALTFWKHQHICTKTQVRL